MFDQLPFTRKELLRDIQQLAPIAGSSIAVPHLANDIDVFILKNDECCLMQILYMCEKAGGKIMCGCDPTYGDGTESIFQILFENEIPIQVILTQHTSVESLLLQFDFDYVRRAIYRNTLVSLPQSDAAHRLKRVLQISDCKKLTRFEKANKKGFAVPIFCNSDKPQTMIFKPCDYQYLKPLKFDTVTTQIDIDSIKLIGCVARKKHFESCVYMNFDLGVVQTRFACFTLTVTRCEQGKGKRKVYVTNPEFGPLVYSGDMELKPDKTYGMLCEMYVNNALKFVIVKVYEQPPPTIPIDPLFWGCKDTYCDTTRNSQRAMLYRIHVQSQKHRDNIHAMNAYAALRYGIENNEEDVYETAARQFAWDIFKHNNNKQVMDAIGMGDKLRVNSFWQLKGIIDDFYE